VTFLEFKRSNKMSALAQKLPCPHTTGVHPQAEKLLTEPARRQADAQKAKIG
jgi:hypothetical protein